MAKSNNACLIKVNTSAGETALVLDAERFTVGRVGADVIIPDKGVSRNHLTVHMRGKEIWLEDMGSANGTFIAGVRISPNSPTLYKPGTPVQLGVSKDMVTFEFADKTPSETRTQNIVFEKSVSRVLPQAPSDEIANQADHYLRSAREAAAQIKDVAAREAEQLVNNARLKANEALSSARAEADQLLERARNSASQATLDREAAAENALASARRESLQIKTAADEEAERISKESRALASQIKMQAQREAEELLRNARINATHVKDEADTEARELIRTTREKNRQAIEDNEAEMERSLSEARAAAADIRKEADQLLEKARTYMLDKGAAVMQEANAAAQRIRSEAIAAAEKVREEAKLTATRVREEALAAAVREKEEARADAGRVRDEARAEGLRTIETGLRDAEAEIKRVKESARQEIENLQAAQKRLEFEVEEVETLKKKLIDDTEALQNEFDEATKLTAESRDAFEAIKSDLDRARADYALARTMKDSADKERASILQERKDVHAEIERVRKEAETARNDIAKELKELREKGLLEFENRKKEQDGELAGMKLQWLEEIKARQMEEERQSRLLKVHQATEMARHLEMLLIPHIQSHLGDRDSTILIADIKNDLEPMVKRVVLEEKLPSGGSEIEQVISADPIIEKFKKRERRKFAAMVMAPLMAFVAAVYMPETFEFARRPLEFAAGGKSAGELAAERRARDIASKKTFSPPQVGEAGKTYTDSVIYTSSYVSIKLEEKFQKKWTLDLEKYMFHELGLPEQAAVSYRAIETRLIKELLEQRNQINPEFEKEGIARLRAIETQAVAELKGKVGGDVNFDKIRKKEKEFFDNFRAMMDE